MTRLDGEQTLPAAESLLFMNALIQSGANVNLANKEGKTALMIATEAGNTEVIDLLSKANVHASKKTLKEESYVNKYLQRFPRVEETNHSNKPENQASG